MTIKSGNVLNVKDSWMYVFKIFGNIWRVLHTAGANIIINNQIIRSGLKVIGSKRILQVPKKIY